MNLGAAAALLMSPNGVPDPYPAYDALRAVGPVVPVGKRFIVTGYEAVDGILRSPKSVAYDSGVLDTQFDDWRANRAVYVMAESMLRQNPPNHTRMRRLASGVFTARRVHALRGVITAQVDEIMDEFAGEDVVDFMSRFAYPLPVAVICALLGIPAEDRGLFRRLAEAMTAVLEVRWTEEQGRIAHDAARELETYFEALIARRRADPRDDLVTALAAAHDAGGDRLTADELMGNLALLLVAGFETTTNLLGNGLVLLLDRPELAKRLAAEPDRAPGYVEEVLRFDPPVQITERFAGADATVEGVRVPAGAEMILLLGAANRDPARFERADVFDPDRPENAPLTFGAGAHYCLGAPLARLEAQIALPALLRRFPGLELAERPERRPRLTLRGWAAVPVELGSVDSGNQTSPGRSTTA